VAAGGNKKALVILNPSVGAHATGRLREELAVHFGRARIGFEIYETQPDVRPAEAVQARLRDGVDFVVAAGGDGTVAAACDALAGSAVPLGIVPIGTGNLVAQELGIPVEIGPAVALLAGVTHLRRIDAMRVRDRLFVLNVSTGLSAAIMAHTTREEKRLLGPVAYVANGLWRAPGYRPHRVSVTIDGVTRRVRAMDVVVMNCGILTRTIYPPGPEVRLDDGHLDVLVLRVRGLLDFPRYFLHLLLRRPAMPLATYYRARHRVVLRSTPPQDVQGDGDVIGCSAVEIELLPAAVSVRVGASPCSCPVM
jgi:diacylglycerol kinase family enzyme